LGGRLRVMRWEAKRTYSSLKSSRSSSVRVTVSYTMSYRVGVRGRSGLVSSAVGAEEANARQQSLSLRRAGGVTETTPRAVHSGGACGERVGGGGCEHAATTAAEARRGPRSSRLSSAARREHEHATRKGRRGALCMQGASRKEREVAGTERLCGASYRALPRRGCAMVTVPSCESGSRPVSTASTRAWCVGSLLVHRAMHPPACVRDPHSCG
jgi:hypothetical protein